MLIRLGGIAVPFTVCESLNHFPVGGALLFSAFRREAGGEAMCGNDKMYMNCEGCPRL